MTEAPKEMPDDEFEAMLAAQCSSQTSAIEDLKAEVAHLKSLLEIADCWLAKFRAERGKYLPSSFCDGEKP